MQGSALLRTFLVFFVGGLLLTSAVITLFLIGDSVWRDCLQDNPADACGDALFVAATSPIYGLVLGMGLNFLPLLVAAVLAVLGRTIFRDVPLWYVMAILPACVLAQSVQTSPWLDSDGARPLFERLLLFSALQTPVLLICWWWDRRKSTISVAPKQL